MTKKDNQIENNNGADWAAILARLATGAIPFAGTFLGEMVTAIIPKQRIDRIAKFVNELNDTIEKMPSGIIQKLKENEDFIDLLEQSFIQATRARSDERRSYIVNLVHYGITDDAAKANDAKHLLGLLAELNDNEVIWLRYFHDQSMGERYNFQETHKNVLQTITPTMGSSKDELEQAALQASYKAHLERLSLIKHKIKTQDRAGTPEFNKDGTPKMMSSRTTALGNMLLESVGLIEAKD